jgi:hypothetical protein
MHRKRRILFCVSIRWRNNVFTAPLCSNGGTHIDTKMEEIHEARTSDGLMCHEIHNKFHKDQLSNLKVHERYTGPNTQIQNNDCISLLSFFQKEKETKQFTIFFFTYYDNFVDIIYMCSLAKKRNTYLTCFL